MSNGRDKTYGQGNPWRDEGQVFRGVTVVVLLIFSGFVLFDARNFYESRSRDAVKHLVYLNASSSIFLSQRLRPSSESYSITPTAGGPFNWGQWTR